MTAGPADRQATETFPLPADMYAAIVAHARAESPRECCGIIAGKPGQPIRIYATRNIAEGTKLYEIDPTELIDLEFRELPSHGTEIIAIYHSHPVSPAYPSVTDVDLAFWPEAIYLICSLADPEQPVVRGFRIRDGVVAEVVLTSG